jgi:hypothetical protein
LHELLVEAADSVGALVVLGPRFVIVTRGGAEAAEDGFEVVLVFQADVLFDQRDAGGGSIVR